MKIEVLIFMYDDKLVQLPRNGRLIVVTDLHGNYYDYTSYLELWDCNDKDCHIVFAGDLIHSSSYLNDNSIEILDDVITKCKKYSNFHVLLGNHEWAHITGTDIYKNIFNQRLAFEKLIKIKKGNLQPTLDNYIDFFKSLPYFIKTDNGLFISHAGHSKKIYSMDDFKKIFSDDYENYYLYDFLWNRYKVNYDTNDISKFLKIIGSNYMIIGHNPVNRYEIFGKQLIISSSYKTDKKTYLDIDLSKNIEELQDLMKFLKYLE